MKIVAEPLAVPKLAETPTAITAPRGLRRFWVAYWATSRVIWSYLWLRFSARFSNSLAVSIRLTKINLENARLIHRTIAELQGLFIKIGQLISIMTNFLPAEFRAELESLQDRVPPRPFAAVEQRFREEFGGRGPQQLFAEFDRWPVAAASIGQVHRARLANGDAVAVKVQYPDIEDIVATDLRILKRILGLISYFFPSKGLVDIYREISEMILQELDFRSEADNLDRIAARFAGRSDVSFPAVRRDFSTSRILTTEWVDGVKISDRARLAALGVDRPQLARAVVNAYCQQIFTDGVYHADPHPGNLLVRRLPNGEISLVFLDFGAVAAVAPPMRRGIADLIQAALLRDTAKLSQAMRELGFIARDADPQVFEKVVDFLHQRFQEEIELTSFSLRDIKFNPQRSIQNLADLRRMNISLRDLTEHFHVPKEWILLERTLLLLMGLCTELDPELNPMEVVVPYLEEFVLGKNRDWSVFLVDQSKEIASQAIALPGELRRILHRVQRGEIEFNTRAHHRQTRAILIAARLLSCALLTIALGAFSCFFEAHDAFLAARFTEAGTAIFALGTLLLLGAAPRR